MDGDGFDSALTVGLGIVGDIVMQDVSARGVLRSDLSPSRGTAIRYCIHNQCAIVLI